LVSVLSLNALISQTIKGRKEDHMFKKILVPLDGSELAAKILPQVEDLARSEQAEITLLTVGNISSVAHLAESDPSLVDAALGALKSAAEKDLTDCTNEMKAKGLKVSWVYREGLPAQEIIQYAAETSCDLIAMATHGRGEVAWMLGSVAEKIVSHATVPVLLMRVIEAQPLMEKSELLGGPGERVWGSE
jgi:nucleotide-binding universal stress UspA family protein